MGRRDRRGGSLGLPSHCIVNEIQFRDVNTTGIQQCIDLETYEAGELDKKRYQFVVCRAAILWRVQGEREESVVCRTGKTASFLDMLQVGWTMWPPRKPGEKYFRVIGISDASTGSR